MANRVKNNLSFRKKLFMVAVAFLFLVLIMASFFGNRGFIEIYQVQKKKQALFQETELLKQKKAKLEREIMELEMNPEAVEKKAREKLWLVKPEETVIIKKNNVPY